MCDVMFQKRTAVDRPQNHELKYCNMISYFTSELASLLSAPSFFFFRIIGTEMMKIPEGLIKRRRPRSRWWVRDWTGI